LLVKRETPYHDSCLACSAHETFVANTPYRCQLARRSVAFNRCRLAILVRTGIAHTSPHNSIIYNNLLHRRRLTLITARGQ